MDCKIIFIIFHTQFKVSKHWQKRLSLEVNLQKTAFSFWYLYLLLRGLKSLLKKFLSRTGFFQFLIQFHLSFLKYLLYILINDHLFSEGNTTERNEDGRNSSLKNFYYFAREVKFDNQDYSAKCVFVENDKGQIFYVQSLSRIEKRKFDWDDKK